jgi:hypothetical protein
VKLFELKTRGTGTYVAMVPTEGTVHLLKAWAVQNQVPLANDLHVTLLYSRNALYVKPNTKEISVQPGGFERFGEALVLKLEF